MATLSDLSLFQATPAQLLESRQRTHVQWAYGLSIEDYLRRDDLMDKMEHAKDGRLTTWVLAPRNNPTTLDFLCSCESFRREGILGTSGHVRFVVAYGIATVFTPERNRKLGYAQHMMRLLHWVLAEPAFRAAHPFPAIWGEPPAVPQHVGNGAWSTLFSDVGPSFYERCGLTNVPGGGWQVDKPVGTVWKVPQEPIFDSEDPEWTPLDLKGAEHLWQEDAKWMAEDVQERSHVEQGITFFAYLPTSGLAAQQVQRTLDPQTGALPFDICGVQHNILSANCVTYATWGLNLRGSGPRSLIVTRLRAPDATVFESLWRQLVRVSQAANIAEIEVWNLPSHLIEIAAHLGGLTRAREEHLPAFMMYSAHHGRPEWMFNEKFGWC